MRASRVEITPWHSTRDTPPPLQTDPQNTRQLDIPPSFLAMSYPYSPGSSRPSANGHHNQSFPSMIPFNRTEGFLAKMFGRRDAAFFIESLLKVDAREVHLVGNVPGWHNALMSQMPSIQEAGYAVLAPNGQPLWLLDFIPQQMYHVVPQKIWTPPNQSDWRRYVEQAILRMPVFFIQNNGAIGLPLSQALNGDRALLRGADKPAPLGGGHSTQIRIAWPGYEPWERQIQIRDQTRQRNEITLERFVKLVAGVVDRFLTGASSIPTQDNAWRVGMGAITRNNVMIVGAVQVSAGGWMPILQISTGMPTVAPGPPHYYPAHA